MRTHVPSGCVLLTLCLLASCSDDGSSPGGQAVAGSGGATVGGGGALVGGGGGIAGRGIGDPTSGASTGGTAQGGTSAGRGGQGGTSAQMGGQASAGAAGEAPIDCGPLVKAPAEFEVLEGFTSSEDFAFDEQGNYVGVDADGNLVRISKAGKKTLWAPGMGSTAGMAILPDGSAVIADVGNGAVKRVFPNGASQVVLGGLLYPNGLDVGPDGFIYVAENNAGRVRRIDPDTGAFTIVAMGLFGPNGVAFSSDPKLMYVGSFEGSGVYRVEIPQPGALGSAKVLARPSGSTLPEPVLACPDQEVGKACTTSVSSEAGKCQKLANVVDCVPDGGASGQCEGKPDGTSCKDEWGEAGTCSDGYCSVADPCVTAGEGTSCKMFGFQGTCMDGSCSPNDPCTGKKAGDACVEGPANGTCKDEGGTLWCDVPDPCADAPDDCATPGGIDGLGVDACGYVYASEFQRGIIWRISPTGELEQLVQLPSQWVPNIKWGRGLGGFGRDVMYVADRDEGRLFGVAVGRPSATEYYDLVKP